MGMFHGNIGFAGMTYFICSYPCKSDFKTFPISNRVLKTL